MRNETKRKLYHNEICFGSWIATSSPTVADILRNLGFDWLVIDTEHSSASAETVNHMLQVLGDSGPTPLVRVGINDQYLIKRALDSGAQGVIVPLVNTAEDAQRAVSHALYPPEGTRGTAAVRASRYGFDFANYVRTANEEVMVVAQIETRQALDNVDAILSVKGLDVAFVGPSDLTMSLGLVDDRSNEKVTEAMKLVVKSCGRHGKIPGVMATSREELKSAVQNGFKFISLASDIKFLVQGAKDFLSNVDRD